MKKRVFAGILMATLILTSVMGVSAANSKEGVKIQEYGTSIGRYEVTNVFEAADEVTGDVKTTIDKVNRSDFSTLPAKIKNELSGKKVIWQVFDLDAIGNHSETCPPHKVTLHVDNLTKSCTEVVVLHYNTEDNAWELITPTVNYDDKTIDVALDHLSPTAVLAKVPKGFNTGGLSYQTSEVSSAWMLWVAVAFVVVGAGVVVSQKKNRR